MRVGNENPVNATAARVMAAGVNHRYEAHRGTTDSELPLPTRPIKPQDLSNPSFFDLTGVTVGRLTVIGMSEKSGRWVCRCACGQYLLRKSSALRSGTAKSAPCDQCYLLAVAKAREFFDRTGKVRAKEDFL